MTQTPQIQEQITLARPPVASGEIANPLSAKDLAFLTKRMGEIGTAIQQGAERSETIRNIKETMNRAGGQLSEVVGSFTGALAAGKSTGEIAR